MAVRAAPLRPAGLLEEQSPLAARIRAVKVLGARHRRLLAALCAGATVLIAVSALSPRAPAANQASSARGRAPGTALPNPLPPAAGAFAAADADRVAVAVRLADPAGLLLLRVGARVEVLVGPPADGGLPAPGGAAGDGTGEVLAPDAVVLAVPAPPGGAGADAAGPGDDAGGGLLAGVGASSQAGQAGTTSGLDAVVLLAVPPSDARRLAAAGSTRSLSVAVGLPTQAKAP